MKQWQMAIVVLLLCSGWLTPAVSRAERRQPVRIGALTASWGPTPGMIGLRDGLLELGYREEEDFFLGVRFVQGNLADLPAAARELVEQGVDLIFTVEVNTKIELAINLKTAETLGLSIPPEILFQATKVIRQRKEEHHHDMARRGRHWRHVYRCRRHR